MRHFASLMVLLLVGGCLASRGLPICGPDRLAVASSRLQQADSLLAAGDSTDAWWGYVNATDLTGPDEPCRDRAGDFARALGYVARNADLYERDSMRVMRRGYHGVHSGQREFRIDGVRIDSHAVALYRAHFQ